MTPHPENNLVHARFFPARDKRRAVVVMPQWNSDAGGHLGLVATARAAGHHRAAHLSKPYHDVRMPPELTRADYIVSSNVVRTVQVCRQAVLDARRALWWLRDQGYERLGLLGTSLGSCLSMLTASHEPLVRAQALNHVSPFFADVVWRGMSTSHVRAGLEGHIDLETLRELWRPISPWSYLERARGRKTLLVYAKYDLTFPVDLSRKLVDEFRRRGIPTDVAVLPCGHYSTGEAPFKYLDGYYLARFLRGTCSRSRPSNVREYRSPSCDASRSAAECTIPRAGHGRQLQRTTPRQPQLQPGRASSACWPSSWPARRSGCVLTDPVTVAESVDAGEVSPLVRSLADHASSKRCAGC